LQKQEYKRVMEIMGAAYFKIHDYDSTIYFDRKALAADKDITLISGWAHTYLGMALYQKNEKEEAIKELKKAIELDKTSGSVYTAQKFLNDIN
jgi:tetratricopeptide (TPR) repeat protein